MQLLQLITENANDFTIPDEKQNHHSVPDDHCSSSLK